jgi:hypothetical protein
MSKKPAAKPENKPTSRPKGKPVAAQAKGDELDADDLEQVAGGSQFGGPVAPGGKIEQDLHFRSATPAFEFYRPGDAVGKKPS